VFLALNAFAEEAEIDLRYICQIFEPLTTSLQDG